MKIKKTLYCSILVLMFLGNMVCLADEHSDYYSLHEENVSIVYFDQAGKQAEEIRRGYKEVNNLNDPKVLCHDELSCGSDDDVVSLPTINIGSASSHIAVSKIEKARVFLPPGTVNLGLTLFTQPAPLIGSVSRFDALPDCVYCGYTTDFATTPFAREGSYLFSAFESDLYLQNAGGHIQMYNKFLFPANSDGSFPYLEKGGWFYLNNYYNAGAIAFGDCAVKVNKEVYLAWYNSYDWNSDPSGLKLGSTVIDDSESQLTIQWLNDTDAVLDVGEEASFSVAGASGQYEYSVGDPDVCTVIANSDGTYTVSALSRGTTDVVMRDMADASIAKTITINVQYSQEGEIRFHGTVPEKIELTVGGSSFPLTVTGGPLPNALFVLPVVMGETTSETLEFIVSDDDTATTGFVKVVSVKDDAGQPVDGKFNMEPISVGSGYLAVVDSNLNFTRILAIEVSETIDVVEPLAAMDADTQTSLLSSSQGLFLTPDSDQNQFSITVSGGTPPYKIKYGCQDAAAVCNASLGMEKKTPSDTESSDTESAWEALGDALDTPYAFEQGDLIRITANAFGKYQIQLEDSSEPSPLSISHPLYSSKIVDAEQAEVRLSLDDSFSLLVGRNNLDQFPVGGVERKEFLLLSTQKELELGNAYLYDGQTLTAFPITSLFGSSVLDWETIGSAAYPYTYPEEEYVFKAVSLSDTLFDSLDIEESSVLYSIYAEATNKDTHLSLGEQLFVMNVGQQEQGQ